MLPQVRAILEAQLRTTLHFYSRGRRTGLALTALMTLFWYGLSTVGAVSIAILFADSHRLELIRRALPAGLLLGFSYWQIVPLMLASAGASLDLKRLAVYPIRRQQLFALELLLRFTSGIEVTILMLGAAVGLWLNPAVAWWAPAAFLPFIALNLCLSAGLRDLLGRMLAGRRTREAAVLLLLLLTVAPQIFLMRGGPPDSLSHVASAFDLPIWPWTLCGRVVFGESALAASIGLLAWAGAAYAFGRWQFDRGFRFDADAARATSDKPNRAANFADALFRLPSRVFRDPLGALIEKELRFLSRSARFRLVFFMGFTFGLLIWLPIALRPGVQNSVLASNYLTLVSAYAMVLLGEVSFWNTFGFDRAAAQFYYLAPVPFSTVLVAKNITSAIFVLLEILAITTVCAALRMPVSLAKSAEALGVACVLALLLVSAGNLGSLHFPRPVNPTQSWRGSNTGRMQALLLFVYPVLGLPVLLAYLARYALGSDLAFWAVLGVVGALAAVVYWVAMDSSLAVAERRKEEIISVLSEGEGPIAG